MVHVRRYPLRLTFRGDRRARIHLAVPRSVGNAVVRNRTRRRLRAALRELVEQGTVTPLQGEYVLGATATIEHLSPVQLSKTIEELFGALGHTRVATSQ